MTKIRFIGDVHNAYDPYLGLLKTCDYSIQVGDLGLAYRTLRAERIDPVRHLAIAGNHENYERESPEYFRKQPWFLGDYGAKDIGSTWFFYVRGAWSIDWRLRRDANLRGEQTSWWTDEELSPESLHKAVDFYEELKPDLMVTHDCPTSIGEQLGDPWFPVQFGYSPGHIKTRTGEALQAMLEIHRPKRWIFGHWHERREITVGGCRFTCLDMIRSNPANPSSYVDLEV